ncbi:MAG: TonB-dependent receptor [Acidobacteriota bacterium]
MFPRSLLNRTVVLALVLLLAGAAGAFAQATRGTLAGLVTDQDESTALPGAIVEAIHTATGTVYSTVTRADGRFSILNVRIGDYTVKVSMDGFRTEEKTGVNVALGGESYVTFALPLASVEETLTVVAEANPLINPGRTGNTSTVPEELIDSLPNVSRSIEDLARTNPFFTTWNDNDDASALSVAGRSNRYNNIQIDGAVNNDLFGLADSGTPGGQAETQPISIEAIDELQLLVAPYDVRQGGFSGGGVNAITKSGTNQFKGTLYYFTADDDLVGDRDDDDGDEVPFGTFDEEEFGVSLGGALVQDKAFFFVNADISERDRPTGFSIGGTGVSLDNVISEANLFRDISINQYGFDPGALGEQTRSAESDKIFARLDFNLAENHQLTFRHNYVDATNDVLSPNAFTYDFPSHQYVFGSETNSTVLQLNSVFGSNAFNEFRVTYQTIEDNRDPVVRFPYVRVDAGPVNFEAGSERFSTANALDQDIFELHNDFTFVRGNHTITIGTHNEFFSFDNLFIRENFGAYRFDSLDDYAAGTAFQYDYSFSATNDPQQSAKFDVTQLGFYVGDQWNVNPRFSLTYGLRVDVPLFPDEPTANPQSLEFGFRTDEMPDGNAIFSPRVGFNWDISGDGSQQLRGGIGIFSGRTPYVWLSNQYSNTGIEFTRISARGDIQFVPDPDNQPTELGFAFTNEINLVDPDFELPQVLRASLGYDRDLGFLGMIGSAEVIFADTREDIRYENLNIVATGETNPVDGRPLFTRGNPTFRDVILLRNTDKGEQLNLALKLERPFRDGWYGSLSYVYGESESINDGNSSQARSNWRFVPVVGNPNDPVTADSNYLVEHRFNATLSYTFDWAENAATTIGLFYNHQSGRPYSTTYGRDVNGDFEDNDLIYVNNPGEIAFVGGAGDEALWEAYINADEGLRDARGSIVKRNESRAPWIHSLDLSIAQQIPLFGRARAEVTFDIENLVNLFDSDAGRVRYVPFAEASPIEQVTDDNGNQAFAADGRPLFDLRFSDPDARFSVDDLRSRWRAKLGLRITY